MRVRFFIALFMLLNATNAFAAATVVMERGTKTPDCAYTTQSSCGTDGNGWLTSFDAKLTPLNSKCATYTCKTYKAVNAVISSKDMQSCTSCPSGYYGPVSMSSEIYQGSIVETNTSCYINIDICVPCADECDSSLSTTWKTNGAYEERSNPSWTCEGGCVARTEYRCAAGYYGINPNSPRTTKSGCTACPSSNAYCPSGDNQTLRCKQNYYYNSAKNTCDACPSIGGVSGRTSDVGSDVSRCFIPANTQMSDTSGTSIFTSQCNYSE